jgi:hypothetical protein
MNFSAAYNNNSFNLSERGGLALVEIMAMCMLVIIQHWKRWYSIVSVS